MNNEDLQQHKSNNKNENHDISFQNSFVSSSSPHHFIHKLASTSKHLPQIDNSKNNNTTQSMNCFVVLSPPRVTSHVPDCGNLSSTSSHSASLSTPNFTKTNDDLGAKNQSIRRVEDEEVIHQQSMQSQVMLMSSFPSAYSLIPPPPSTSTVVFNSSNVIRHNRDAFNSNQSDRIVVDESPVANKAISRKSLHSSSTQDINSNSSSTFSFSKQSFPEVAKKKQSCAHPEEMRLIGSDEDEVRKRSANQQNLFFEDMHITSKSSTDVQHQVLPSDLLNTSRSVKQNTETSPNCSYVVERKSQKSREKEIRTTSSASHSSFASSSLSPSAIDPNKNREFQQKQSLTLAQMLG
eukprot:GDKJ01008982.1.p1 GENE.GDKJ01008982.1~~GDKJ01008982.1.p1  ORF type:complete len:350 (-),score=85.27 GDKJ01008982.1:395-1444(-)